MSIDGLVLHQHAWKKNVRKKENFSFSSFVGKVRWYVGRQAGGGVK